MTPVEVQYSVKRLNEACRLYGQLSGKSEAEVIQKQSDKLGYNLSQGLRKLAPQKGAVRAERLAALKAGYGVHVRPAVYEAVMAKYGGFINAKGDVRFFRKFKERTTVRGLNFQALAVKAELGLRESGRGFMAYSTPRARSYAESLNVEKESRYGKVLSVFDMDVREDAEHKFARFTWPENAPATAGLSKEQQMRVVNDAVNETSADIEVYIKRKLGENKQAAGF